MSLSIGDATFITGLFQKKSKHVVEDMLYFSENPLFLEKTSFHPRKFCKNVWYPLEIPRSKTKTPFHMSSPWKPTSFLIDSRNFHMSFTTPGNCILSTTLYLSMLLEEVFFFLKRHLWYCIYLLYLINSSVLLQSVPFFHDSLSIIYHLFLQ